MQNSENAPGGEYKGRRYTLLKNGSVEADTLAGLRTFPSLDDFKAYVSAPGGSATGSETNGFLSPSARIVLGLALVAAAAASYFLYFDAEHQRILNVSASPMGAIFAHDPEGRLTTAVRNVRLVQGAHLVVGLLGFALAGSGLVAINRK